MRSHPREIVDNRTRCKLAGLRPTRQRLTIADHLFGEGHRHVTPKMLYEEVRQHDDSICLATVYNCLHRFAEAGLVNTLGAGGGMTYFDTNTSRHSHLFIEGQDLFIDVAAVSIQVPIPEDYEIDSIDVTVRVTAIGHGPKTTSKTNGSSL